MILSLPVGWTARLQALRSVPRDSRRALRNGSFKVRRWPEGDRTAGAMASIAPGAASPYPTGIPHPSEPPTSSQPERWRLPWRRRQCQPSTGIRGFGEVRDSIAGWRLDLELRRGHRRCTKSKGVHGATLLPNRMGHLHLRKLLLLAAGVNSVRAVPQPLLKWDGGPIEELTTGAGADGPSPGPPAAWSPSSSTSVAARL